jgi:uncharacterized repeat protein (TIGR01451 family)/fimbrial isopeptide formation D2 family protein
VLFTVALAMVGLFSSSAAAAPLIVSSTTFRAADGVRTYMDRGGVWNGSTEVTATTGDTVQFTVCNNASLSTDIAYSLTSTATLSAGFSYVAGTINGIAGITATPSGSNLIINIPSAVQFTTGTCLTVGFGVTAGAGVTNGTYPINYTFGYGTTFGASDGTLPFVQNLLVQSGGATIQKGPANQLVLPGNSLQWTVTVTNTGLGGMFGVILDETAINPSSAFSLVSLTKTAPASPAASYAGGKLTLPYLAPGQQYVAVASATALSCFNLNNIAYVDDRTHVSSGSASTQALLDFRTPSISLTVPDFVLDNQSSTTVNVVINNSGTGDAKSLVLATTLPSYPVAVSVVSAGWTYDAVSGSFTKTGNGGTESAGGGETLTFKVSPLGAGQCTAPPGGLYFVTAGYTDICGNPYTFPVGHGNLSTSYTQPSVAVSFTMPGSYLTPSNLDSSTETVAVTHSDLLASDPIVVVSTLPVNVSSIILGSVSGGQTVSCGGPCLPGGTVVWKIPNPHIAGTATYLLPVTFSLPSSVCSDNQSVVFLSNIVSTDSLTCPYDPSGVGSAFMTNLASSTVSNQYSQSYTIAPGTHETGLSDNGNAVRDAGEGEFVAISASYTFPSGFNGNWVGSTFADDFAGISTTTLVPGTLTVSWDNGAPQAIPSASVSQTSGGLKFTADFLAGPSFINAATVAGHSVRFDYKVTSTDNQTGGAEWSDFSVKGATGACTGASATKIIQEAGVTFAHATEVLSLAIPSVIDVCQTFTATATVNATNFNAYATSATISVLGSSYTYLTPQTPTYGGAFAGNVTYAENGGIDPTFTYNPATLLGSGSFNFQMRRSAASGTGNSSLPGTDYYQDWQTHTTGAILSASASAAPTATQQGKVTVVPTPQAISVTASSVTWVLYVNDTAGGGLYNLSVKDVLPPGLSIDQAHTDALNPNYHITSVVGNSVTGTTVTWSQTTGAAPINLTAGGGIALNVVALVAGNTCSLPSGANAVLSRWGCDGTDMEDVFVANPNFSFPTGSMQATHDSVNTFTRMCSQDYDTIILTNTGLPHIYNAQAQEILNPATTGVDIVLGTVQVSTDSGVTWAAAGDPTGAGTTASPYTWTSVQVPQLADISPFGSGTYNTVRIRFQVSASELTNGLIPSVTSKASGSTACGAVVTDPGTPFTLVVRKPDFTVTKLGKNITAGSPSFTSTVYGGVGDTIQWQITAQNNGLQQAQHLRLLDILPGDGGAATVSGPGFTGTPALTSNYANDVSTLASLGNAVYTVTETLGASCVSNANTANFSWGCSENTAGLRSGLTTPTNSTGTATLVMTPNFVSGSSLISFNALHDGRSEVVVHFVNNGGTAQNIVIYSTIPAGEQWDATSTPTWSTNGTGLTTMVDGGTLQSPKFVFSGGSGLLRNGEFVEVRYRVIQTGNFDVNTSSFNFPDTVGAGTDPSPPAGGSVYAEVDFANTCVGNSSQTISGVLTPPEPDVDVTLSPSFLSLVDGASQNFDFTLVNAGAALSVADNIGFYLPVVGGGWTVNSVTVVTPGTGGTGGACQASAPFVCAPAQIGYLTQAQTALIRVNATAHDNGLPLTLQGLTTGQLYTDNGTNTGNNYSYDAAAPKVVGISLTDTLLATSEATTSTGTLAIGEEATFELNVRWFGGADVSAITVRDTLPNGLGFVSASTTTGNTVGVPTITGNTQVQTGAINFAIPNFSGSGTFVLDLVARELNIAANTNGLVQTDNLGAQFTSNSQVFASNNATDGFGGTLATLHGSTTTTVGRPVLAFSKQVEDLTAGGSYAGNSQANGGDAMQYKLTLTNSGSVPAFDITIEDAFGSPKMLMNDGSANGGQFVTGAGGSVTYNAANFTTPPLGQNLTELDPGQTVTMVYQSSVSITSVPNDVLNNAATYYAYSLHLPYGGESQAQGAPSSQTGPLELSGKQVTPVTVSTISFNKAETAVSLTALSTNVVVGEQVQFTLTLVLPPGNAPGLNVFDTLPAGLSLVQALPGAVTLGSALTGAAPTITNTGSHYTWNFGAVSASSNTTAAARTITIPYIVQVNNTAGVVDGTTLVNSSSYSYVGSPPANASSVTLGVKEPIATVAIAMTPATGLQGGSVIVATITVTNAGHATADDLNLYGYLPAYMTYVPGTTFGLTGPAIGEPDVNGSTITWGRAQTVAQTLNVTTTTALSFRFSLLIGAGAPPSQPLAVTAIGDWTSLPGAPGPNLGPAVGTPGTASGERTGSGVSPDLYRGVASATTTVTNLYSVSKSSAAGPLPDASYRVGDLVPYTVSMNFQGGTANNVFLLDTLPAGLQFHSFAAITPASGTGNFAYTAPAGGNAPVADVSTGTIAWNIGPVTYSGTGSGTLTLTYNARVLDSGPGAIAAASTKINLLNGAVLRYSDFSGSQKTTAVSGSTVTVEQPSLTFSKISTQSVVTAGSPIYYHITVTNAGAGPAYDLQVQDNIPVGAQTATPVVSSATLNGVGITLSQSYVGGVVQWTLSDPQVLLGSVVGSTRTLKIDYIAQVDAGEGAALTLTNSANVTKSFAQDSTCVAQCRQYAASASSAATVTTPMPAGIQKWVSVSTAAIGGSVAYTVAAPSTTVSVALYKVRVKDQIPAGLTVGAYGNNAASLTPGACGAITVTDNNPGAAGNLVDLTYSCLPPGAQAVVSATTTVSDIGANLKGTVITNGANFVWRKSAVDPTDSAVISTSGFTTIVQEPFLGITKALVSVSTADATQGLQAGDKVRYRIKIAAALGANNSAANALVIHDVADTNLISPTVYAFPDNPGVPTDNGAAPGGEDWKWSVPGPLQPGATYQFDVEFTLGPGVQPMQSLVNGSTVTWSSQPGSPAGSRTGAGGVDDYSASAAPVTAVVGPVHAEKAIKAPGGTTYAVGSNATFRLDFSFGQGTVNGVHLLDALPTGLVFSTATVSTTNAQKSGGGAVALLSGPAPGATGNLDFSLGAVQSTGLSPTVHVDVTARVQDIPANSDGHPLTNGVSGLVLSSTGGVVGINPMNPLPTITVVEPKLVLAFDGPPGDTLDLGGVSTYTVRVKNFGDSPAYQPTVAVQLGAGLQAFDPSANPTSIAVSGGRAFNLVSGTDYTVSYATMTGILSFVLTSSQAYAAVGETLTLKFQDGLDNDAVSGRVLDSTAAVTQYYSTDTSAGVGADDRAYPFLLTASAGHIADGTVQLAGDGRGDDAPITVRAPLISLVKSVNPFGPVLPTDTQLTWSVAVANGGAIASAPGVFTDDLGAYTATSQYISSGTLSTTTVVGVAGFTDSSNPNGGTSNKGLVKLTNFVVPAMSTVTVSFWVRISTQIPNQTQILNRASLTVPGFTPVFLSTSNRAGDPGGATAATVTSAPGFTFNKTAVVVGGGSLLPGSTIQYTLAIRNGGTERALTSVITDAIPANTSYVPNSTTLNGAAAPDVAGASPLSAGLAVNSPTETSGILDVYTGGNETDVTFRVRVATGVPSGTAISNQALLAARGEGTGTPISKLSDDPTTTPTPDPTVLIVSGGAYLVSEKTSSIDVPPALLANGTLTYTIMVRNLGDVAAASVKLQDPMPSNTSYVPGTLQYAVAASSASLALAPLTDAADGDAGNYGVTTASAVTVNIGTVAAHGIAEVSFRVKVAAGAASGTLIVNQASITASGLPLTLSDGDGNHGNGDQPTYNVVGATGTPILKMTKQVAAVNGGVVSRGDPLQYQISVYNVGNGTATNVTVLDAIPGSNSVYSTGTTKVNGVAVADAGLISPLVAGYNIGTLNPGDSALVTFRVTVTSTAADGANVVNQSSYTANAGTLTGSSCSDRPDCVTLVQVGGTPGSAALSGVVWEDSNHNRVYDAGEPPQGGWTVEVLRGGVVVATAKTAADGTYRIPNLAPGTGYQVRFRNPQSNAVYGKALSAAPGADLSDGTIRNLTLNSGDNILQQDLPLDPNGVIYDSLTRKPISGVQVFLDGPAGFDPTTMLLPGQNGQVTGSDGLYRFDINFGGGAPFGVYTLRAAAPPGYLTTLPGTPSTNIAPSTSTLGCASLFCLNVPAAPDPYLVQAQSTAPAIGQATPYYLRFQYLSAPLASVVNDHVPLDPILNNALFITKTVRVADVSRGDLVYYTITARNTLSATLTNIDLVDMMPPGFKYRSGSASLNRVAAEPVSAGRKLTWPGLTFAPNETKTFNMLLIVGSGVSFGRYVNQAWGVNSLFGATVSNLASAAVDVIPDPDFDCTDLIGKVYDDKNANGYQDPGEKGLPNVRLVTVRGWLVATDAEGRFHIACADVPNQDHGSNFVMKLDESTLPTGYRMTTENPRAVRLTAGKFARIDFGAALYQVVRLDLSSAAFVGGVPPPAPAPAKPAPPRERWEVYVDSAAIPPIRFAVAKFAITAEHIETIRGALERVKAMDGVRNVKLRVIGHTDATPISGKLKETIADNWALSRSRAESTAAHLREQLGLKPEMLVTDGKADTEPLADDKTVEGRALNRRVEVQVIYEKKAASGSRAEGADAPVAVSTATGAAAPAPAAPWVQAVGGLLDILGTKPSVVRLGYCRAPGEKIEVARFRLWQAAQEIEARWRAVPDRYALTVERELDGASCPGARP